MINMTKRRNAKTTKRPKRRSAAVRRTRARNEKSKNQPIVVTPDFSTSVEPKNSTPIKYLTDLNVASFLVKLHGKDIRYLHPAGRWLVWDGKRWGEDSTGEIVRRAKHTTLIIREIVKTIQDDDERARLLKRTLVIQGEPRIKAMINLAQSEQGIPVTADKLDSNPWLLNVQNGTIDLKTAELRPHKQENLITKLTDVPYNRNAACPVWEGFIQHIMNNDADLIRFLQKFVGYSLTGNTAEQVMFMLYGNGANGKSTFIATLLSLVGDYGLQTPTETLLNRRENAMSNDIARLRGARFVSAVESEHGRKLAEVQVKQLTGGDVITARFLYHEFFQFIPEFKLVLAMNNKPTIEGADHGIWRRIRVIPFTVTIPPEEQDKNLGEKLKKELPGILRWAVEGALLWQKEGLQAPESVKAITETYRSEMDVLDDFIKERCDISDPTAETPFKELYFSYQDWCIPEDEEPISKKEFAQRLTERGFNHGRNSFGRFRLGIRLKT
jgi:putative DNA primase/helicase